MKINHFIYSLLFIPKCIGCGSRYNIFSDKGIREDVFCLKCRADWELEKLEACSGCGVAAIDCTCCPSVLDKKYIDCISVVKFGRTRCADRLIYTLKRRRLQSAFDFAADELAKRWISYCSRTLEDLSGAVFTNVPRSYKSILNYGFDHAELLARTVAEKVDGKYENIIFRTGKSKDQKKLDQEKRVKNVEGKFLISEDFDLKGNTVVLVDDVVTTGSTAFACAKLLRGSGVKKVIVLSIARAPIKRVARRTRESRIKR